MSKTARTNEIIFAINNKDNTVDLLAIEYEDFYEVGYWLHFDVSPNYDEAHYRWLLDEFKRFLVRNGYNLDNLEPLSAVEVFGKSVWWNEDLTKLYQHLKLTIDAIFSQDKPANKAVPNFRLP